MHALDLAANLDRIARLELFLQCRNDLVDLIGNASEVATLHAGVNFVRWLDVRLIQIGLRQSQVVATNKASCEPRSNILSSNR